MSSKMRSIVSKSRLYSTYHMSRVLSSNPKMLVHQSITLSLGHRHFSNYARMQNYNTHRRNFSVSSSVQPGAPLPSQPPSYSLRWILGILLSIILPIAGNKWGPLLEFKKEVDTTVETIEVIVDVVGKVADVVDKVAEGIDGDLPDGGKLKIVMDIVEDVAEKTAKDAQTVGDAINKFQEVEGKVESIVETLSDRQAKQ